MNASPIVGVVMGSKSDYDVLLPCLDLLREFAIPHEARIVSAHRTPDWLFQYAEQAEPRGLKIIIAAAGGAAHLPGMLAAKTILPVLQGPCPSPAFKASVYCFPFCRCRRVFPSPPWPSVSPAPPMPRCWRWPSWPATTRSWGAGSAHGAWRAPRKCWKRSCPVDRHRSGLDHRHPGGRSTGAHDRHGGTFHGLSGAGDGSRPVMPGAVCGGFVFCRLLG